MRHPLYLFLFLFLAQIHTNAVADRDSDCFIFFPTMVPVPNQSRWIPSKEVGDGFE